VANRYWVGGAGTWNTSSTTNWSSSSGGGGGFSVPTAADSVFFDRAGTYTVTCTGALTCLDITVSAGTVTFADGTTPTFAISGSMSLIAGTLWPTTGTITFNATTTGKTVTTNGTTINGVVAFNGIGGGWTLGSALTTPNTLSISNGTFDTSSIGNYAVSCAVFNLAGSTTRTVNLNASTITISFASSSAFTAGAATGRTFNAGTSQINLTSATSGITSSGALTLNNVAFTSVGVGTRVITTLSTPVIFNNLSVTAPSVAGVATLTFDSNQTINGTLSTTGTAGNRRVFFASDTYGIGRTLTCNSAASLTDADFRDIYVIGTAAPISGTRIGNRGNCTGITFDAPKTVYWNLAAGGNWSDNAWATSSGGTVSTNNFPLPQDTATIVDTGLTLNSIISFDGAIPYVGSINMSARTVSFTLSFANDTTVYGNWTNGSGSSIVASSILTFSGGNTQTITSAGKILGPITVDTYGGTVQLGDALNITSNQLLFLNGTFNTQGYAMTAGAISSVVTGVRTMKLNNSIVTLSSASPTLLLATNFTFDAGTSEIILSSTSPNFGGVGFTFYNLSFTSTSTSSALLTGANTFNNLTITAPSANGITSLSIFNNQTINGTLTCAGASSTQRIFLKSDTTGTQRTLTVNSLSATDCDFCDIVIAGTASGTAPTRAGNCGNNSGITFPSPKTVYWNLAGSQNWSSTGWCTASGGTPAVNNFPLAQDTAVFDNTGSAGTVTIDATWNIGTFDASARTSAMTFDSSNILSSAYGDWKFGTGVTVPYRPGGQISFLKNGTQTITCNGVQFGFIFKANSPLTTIQLADAFSLNSSLTLNITQGTFDAVSYNVTVGAFSAGSTSTVKMGSGTWTLTGTSFVWNPSNTTVLYVGTSNIVLSNTSTLARTFAGGNLYYNKLTIGGTTGTSTLTISGNNIFGELASTKTVAHTIAFGTASQNFGKWSVTGTVGNVVTITGTDTNNGIYGPAVTGIDYLAMGTWGISTASPGEFYAGANSTGTATAPVYRAAAPTPRTLYWVGGTGNWSSTANWSTSSGGGAGAAIPTSLDTVTFNSASNAGSYTTTVNANSRCASFTMAGPASGNVSFAGTFVIFYHGSVSFAATGILNNYTGQMYLAGNSSYTFTTNGLTLASSISLYGIGATWSLGSAVNNPVTSSSLSITYGALDTTASNYAVTFGSLFLSSYYLSVKLNGSTVTLASATTAINASANQNFNAGTSQINLTNASSATITSGGLTFYNVSFTSTSATTYTFTGNANTFNNLTFAGLTFTSGITTISFSANQTINGTLTVSAGTAAAYRKFLASDTIGTTRTLTCAAVSLTDTDFRDITIAGAAAPASGTRLGDAKGNSGITFPAAKTVYYGQTISNQWGQAGAGNWSLTSGGSLDATAFPLAQDTAVFPAATYPASGSTTTINANYNIGTIDMSLRTSNTMTLATGTTTPAIYGNWINGTGITLSGTQNITFAGRITQQFTSASVTFIPVLVINSPAGTFQLQDAFTSNAGRTLTLTYGTLDLQSFTLTTGLFSSSNSNTRTINFGSGTIALSGTGTVWTMATSTNATINKGTGTISLTDTSTTARTFAGGGLSYPKLSIGGATGVSTLTISGNNTFAEIASTKTVATTISLAATTQTVVAWTATGTSGNLLTITGTSAASPATLVYTGAGSLSGIGYVVPTFVRAYPTTSTWNVGLASTNGGSLGFIFAAGGTVYSVSISEAASGVDSVVGYAIFYSAVQELASGIDSIDASFTASSNISETASAIDSISSVPLYASSISETASGVDATSSAQTFANAVSETGSGVDQISSSQTFITAVSETGSGTDSISSAQGFASIISETGSGIDQISASFTASSNISESASGVDAVSSLASFASSISETGAGLDQINTTAIFISSIAENSAGLDQVNSSQTFITSLSETASGVDAETVAASTFNAYSSETASGVDSESVAASTFNAYSDETASGVDAVSSKQSFASDISETAAGLDAPSAVQQFVSSVAETASGIDQVDSAQAFRSTIAETASGVDSDSVAASTFNAFASEASSGVDSISSNPSFGSAVNETGSGVDSISSKQTFVTAIAETAAGLDTPSVAASTFKAAIAETASGVDSISSNPNFGSSISETASGVDSISSSATFASSIAETASGVDSIYAYQGFGAFISETASGLDAISTVGSIFTAAFTDSASGIDVNQPNFTYNITVPEGVNAQDLIYARYLWELIDNTETADWGVINDTQTASWSQIDDTQALNWQNVGNTQTATWSQIDDTESGNWEQI